MAWKVLIAHAEGEEHLAEQLAEPLRSAGYEVAHQGTVLVGESVVEEASKVLSLGGPVVLCGTVKAVGTGWAHKLVNAARRNSGVRVFPVQIEKDAYLESIAFESKATLYWQDSSKAIEDLLVALRHYYPLDETQAQVRHFEDAEERYRSLLLETCDIVNLANLPEQDRILVLQRQLELRRLYVPLRVWVDIKTDEESEEEDWDELELRRDANFKGQTVEEEIDRKRQPVPVGERLAKAKKLVVLGEPGSGKSTLTRWIATAYLLRLKSDPDLQDLPDVKTLPDEDWLPIIIRCRDLDQSSLSGNLHDILSHTLRKAELTEAEASSLLQVLHRRLKEGTALLMLDGLDEISDSRTRASFCQHLERIHVAYSKAPIIATSRIVGYREMGYRLGRGFEHVTLADLDVVEKDDFARRWCNLTELPEQREDAARKLIHDIHSSDRIEHMTGNPMLLTTMALVKRKVGKLPSRRADLYGEAVQVLLNWRSEVGESLDQYEAIPQLEYVAYAMCDRGFKKLREDEIVDLITKMRVEYPNVHKARNHNPDAFLHLLEARTGLLAESGHTNYLGMSVPIYEFRHLTFQEFLAARALVDGKFPGRDATRPVSENVARLAGKTEVRSVVEMGTRDVAVVENWREALRLCTAICRDDDVDMVMESILFPLEGEPETTRRARAIMATLCVADEPNVDAITVKKIFEEFSSQIREDDGNWSMITNANSAAMEVAITRWADQLRASLVNEFIKRDSISRNYTGSLCGMVGAKGVPKDPIELDAWLRGQVELILNGSESEAIEGTLTFMEMSFEQNRSTKSDKNKLCIPVQELTEALLTRLEGSAPMAHAAAWALLNLSEESKLGIGNSWHPKANQIERILTIIGDSNSDPEAVRFLTLIAGKLNISAALEPLLALINHSSPAMRRDVTKALGRIGGRRAVESLIDKLNDPETQVRYAAAVGLGKIGGGSAVEPLIEKLKEPEPNMRYAAAVGLGKIGGGSAVESLIEMLNDPEAQVRYAAAAGLGRIGGWGAVKPLINMLNDPDAQVRHAVAGALGKVGGGRAARPLMNMLNDPEANVRYAVAGALGKVGGLSAVQPLIVKLNDPEAQVRYAAAGALGKIGGEPAVEPLINKLNDPEAQVRYAAAGALGKIGGEPAVEPLINKLNDPEALVRHAAANSLGRIGGERGMEALKAKLDDPEAEVRSAALLGLSIDLKMTDRVLLTTNLNNAPPFIDPHQEITAEFANKAAKKQGIMIDEVKTRYEALAKPFHLNLAWNSQARDF